MNPKVNKSAAGNTQITEGQNSPSSFTNLRDQIFLKALQDLIVCVMDPRQTNDQIPLGPEAEKLIIALRDFVASMVGRSESMTPNPIELEVSLDEDSNVLQGEDKEDSEDKEDGKDYLNESPLKGISLAAISSAKPHGEENRDINSQRLDFLENPQSTFHDKLRKGLREHVFNAMPIRMLSFEPRGSGLRIALVERGAIYARLASELQAKINEVDHVPIFDESSNGMETEQQAIDRLVSKYARYAILSHTWLQTSDEVTYGHWNKGLFDASDPGYQKLVNFCRVAWRNHGLTLGWMDTVCINKESSSELDESIRSMYDWYNRAVVCITYLAETETLPTMHNDRWFTRGWTLQELLSPDFIKFYNSGWKRLGDNSGNDKKNAEIAAQIKLATTLSEGELQYPFPGASISRRMQLAAAREVTREEDTAYSLMGIFDVSISIAYGEGAERAFFRLLQEILASHWDVLDILNWAGDLEDSQWDTSQILPSSPLFYLQSCQFSVSSLYPVEPLALTHLGLRVPVILMPAISIPDKVSQYIPFGDYSATVEISPVGATFGAPDATYNLLDRRVNGPDGHKENLGGHQLRLAVFNFSGDATGISIMRPCMAKVLEVYEEVGKVTSLSRYNIIHTDLPVFFSLTSTVIEIDPTGWFEIHISRDELAKHGMQLVSLYL